MIKITRLAVAAIAALTALTVAAEGPELVFDHTSADLGAGRADSVRSHEFVFRNAGTEPLSIIRVFSDCGCTVASYTRTPVLPDSTGIVTVMFDGKGRRPGGFIKRVRVSSNDPKSPVYLYINGKVI